MNWWLIYIGIAFISFALVQKFFPARHPNIIDPSPTSEIATLKDETGTGTIEPKLEPGIVVDKDGTVHAETTVQRYLRTEAEWRRLSNLSRDEETDLKREERAAFREFMDAGKALKAEAEKGAP